MSGPIVRSGPSPEYSKNWDEVFSSKKETESQSEEHEDKPSQANSENEESA